MENILVFYVMQMSAGHIMSQPTRKRFASSVHCRKHLLNSLHLCWNDVQLIKHETKTAIQRDKQRQNQRIYLTACVQEYTLYDKMIMGWQRGEAVECLMARCRQHRTGINDDDVRSLVEFQKFLIGSPVFPRTYTYLQFFRGSCRQRLQLNSSAECRLIAWHTVITRTA